MHSYIHWGQRLPPPPSSSEALCVSMSHWVTGWDSGPWQPPCFGAYWGTGQQSPEWCRVAEHWDENQLLSRDYLDQKHCFVPEWLYFSQSDCICPRVLWILTLLGVFPKKKNSWISSCSGLPSAKERCCSFVWCAVVSLWGSISALTCGALRGSWPFLLTFLPCARACFWLSGSRSFSQSFEGFLLGFVWFFSYCLMYGESTEDMFCNLTVQLVELRETEHLTW